MDFDYINFLYSLPNFKEINISDKKECIIFCSSNGLLTNCNSDNYLSFKERYEWENISKSKRIKKFAGKIIFVRDVYSSFYMFGINSTINNIDSLISLIKEHTQGYRLTIVGYSSGGYLSTILGSKLENVRRVLSFAGVFCLGRWTGAHNNYDYSNTHTYLEAAKQKQISKWFDLRNILSVYNTNLFHFYSAGSKADLIQLDSIKNTNSNIISLGLQGERHQLPLNGFDYPKLIVCKDEHLTKIMSLKTPISRTSFSLHNLGFFGYIFCQIKRLFNKVFSGRKK